MSNVVGYIEVWNVSGGILVTSVYTNIPKRREPKQYAEHTKQSMLTNLLIQHQF